MHDRWSINVGRIGEQTNQVDNRDNPGGENSMSKSMEVWTGAVCQEKSKEATGTGIRGEGGRR